MAGTEISANSDLLAKLVKWFEDFESETTKSRQLSEKDRDYYDGHQWSEKDIGELGKRNQPVVTYNRIAPKINYLRGYEMSTRIDPRVFPRTPAHEDAAIAATDGLRYVADCESFDKLRSRVFEYLLVEGYGGCVVEPEVVEKSKPVAGSRSVTSLADGMAIDEVTVDEVEEQVEIRLRPVAWDRIFYDPHSSEPDFSDAKYLGVVTWWYLDDAKDDPRYADRADELDQSVHQSATADETFEDRPREGWTKSEPERVRICEIYWRQNGCWYTAHYTKGAFLVDPVKIDLVDERDKTWCPLLLTSAFVDRHNWRYGVVRCMISAQEEINKRRSKALHLLTMRQVMAEEGAVADPMEAQAEFAKPDGWVKLNHNALAENRIQLGATTDMAQGQLQLLAEAKLEIDSVGPDAPIVGEDRRVMSGRAIAMRQQTSSMQLEPLFDNLRDWQKRVFRSIWWMIRQFWPEERWVRVRDDQERAGWRFVALNQRMTRGQRLQELVGKGMPFPHAMDAIGIQPVEQQTIIQQAQQVVSAQMQQMGPQGQPQVPPEAMQAQAEQMLQQLVLQHPRMQEMMVQNDVGALDVDIVIDATPDTAVVQQEEFAELVEMGQAAPGSIPPQVIIQASQLRNKREILAMMQKPPDPLQQQVAQLNLALLQANVQKTQAQAMDEQASAQQRMAEMASKNADVPLKQAQAMEHAAKAGERTTAPQIPGPTGMPHAGGGF
jgi:hypothetical protein